MLGGLSAPGLLAVGHRKGCYVILAAVCILGQWLWTFKWFRVGQVGVGGGGGQSLLGQAGAVLHVRHLGGGLWGWLWGWAVGFLLQSSGLVFAFYWYLLDLVCTWPQHRF